MSSTAPQSPALALAVDLGGTKVEAALVTDQGVVLPATRFRSPTGPQRISNELQAAVDEVVTAALGALPADATLVGVGVGSAGPVDEEHGLVSPLNMPVWRGHPLRDRIAALVPDDVPVTLRMDGLAITLAEHWVGAAQGYEHVMGMIVSTGVGGGLILHGRTVSGPTGNAGHIGHVECGGYDDPCACGGTGCLEAIASGPKTVAWARRLGFAGTTGEELSAAYAAGDEIAVAAIQRSGRALGQAIAAATSLVDLEIVAIGGGFSHVTPDLFEYARQAVAERVEFGFVTKVEIVPTGLSQDGPLIGAAALVHRADVLR
ncbi:ROK family protein [Curtobacterium flaccumfaciens pv. flaccumfaciens]|uniref:ROK family protein n=1 Tax=Curtobacterium flaccumfaciens TaxID=2035 RepID=UPI00217E054F|nr:ROK family protein [Curtobacterium flaccumfaciens]MCS6551605.1 ROK family protein [Curtobacterium flaccumfaciens pv. flaccumfaciens]